MSKKSKEAKNFAINRIFIPNLKTRLKTLQFKLTEITTETNEAKKPLGTKETKGPYGTKKTQGTLVNSKEERMIR